MENSRLIQILRTFSKQEWKDFGKFIASPYFNRGRDLTALLKTLKNYYPDFSSNKLTRENIYAKLFPGKTYKNTVMKTMLSGLNSMAEQFSAQKVFDTNRFEIINAKLNSFHNRNLEKQFSDSMKFASERFSELGIVDPLDALRNKYEISLIEATFLNGRRNLDIKNKNFDVTTSVATLFFMEYFVTYADEVAKSNAINQPMPEIIDVIHNNIDFDNIIPKMAESNPSEAYKILFYFGLYRARRNKEITYFYESKKIFYDNLEVIPKPTKQSFIFLMLNCVVYLIRSNSDIKLEEERYGIIKFMYDNDLHIFPGDEMLPLASFKNALILSLIFDDTAFTMELLEKHVNAIHKSMVEPYKQYGYAMLAFKKKDFEHSMELLQKIDLSELSLRLEVKVLSSKLFYELGYWENAFSFVDSYRKYLAENTNVSTALRNESLKYLKYYHELLKVKTSPEKTGADHLITVISKDPLREDQRWFLNKIKEL